ncbi:hypothetical protein E2C01_015022 [Portunus trituberculatus]|uniref:Uncharacterized protein n=1 Tax=Portunus trituberculatus TaxID=210409 RepID=A0A5B7DM15_PORTR|nr:hypothetical protein [Portunus trituberculatus]
MNAAQTMCVHYYNSMMVVVEGVVAGISPSARNVHQTLHYKGIRNHTWGGDKKGRRAEQENHVPQRYTSMYVGLSFSAFVQALVDLPSSLFLQVQVDWSSSTFQAQLLFHQSYPSQGVTITCMH